MSTYNTCTCISIQLALMNIGLYAGTCIHADPYYQLNKNQFNPYQNKWLCTEINSF